MYLSKISNGTYYLYYKKEDGNKTRVSCGTKSKSEAMKFLTQFDAKLKKEAITPTTISLGEFRDQFLNHIEVTHTPTSYRMVKQSFKELIVYLGGRSILLNEITQRTMETFLFSKFQVAKHSAHLKYRNLKAAFNKAVEWDLIPTNPFAKIRMPKIPETQPAYINKEQLEKIVKEEPKQQLKDIYTIAFYTGMRRGELCNLTWPCIDLENNFIKVSNTETFTTKSKRERQIPMTKVVREILERMKLENVNNAVGHLFSLDSKNAIDGNYVCRKFKDAVQCAELSSRIHFHSLRHSFCSALVEKGVNVFHIKQLAGHQSISVTERYTHLRKESLNEAMKSLD